MKIKSLYLFTILVLVNITSFAECVITCTAKYWEESKTETTIGASGMALYNEIPAQWSNSYTVNIYFYSGYECNQALGYEAYNNHSIIGIIKWDNGGASVITIKGWTTNLQEMTEDEVRYDTFGNTISSMKGYDTHGTLWEIDL